MTKPPFKAEPPLTADEVLPPGLEAELAEALLNAANPAELDPELNEALIRDALEDPLRTATADELVESERLREALAQAGTHPDLDLLGALYPRSSAPRTNREADEASERAALRALGTLGRSGEKRAPTRGGASNLIYVGFGVASAITLAAAAALLVMFPIEQRPPGARAQAPQPAPVLTQSRSGSALFHQKFEHHRTTWRVDTIASLRARELRSNRYKEWGLR